MSEDHEVHITDSKVAAVVSPHHIAIADGSASGIKVGDVVSVLRSVDVPDPDTGAKLGTVSFKRATFEVTSVQDALAVAVVLDRVPGSTMFEWSASPRVELTTDSEVDDPAFLPITIGELARVHRRWDPDEPPF